MSTEQPKRDVRDLRRQLRDARQQLREKKRRVAILSIDQARSTESLKGMDAVEALTEYWEYRDVVDDVLQGSELIPSHWSGDGKTILVASVDEAVALARKVQTAITGFNLDQRREEAPFRVRCGVHVGELVVDESLTMSEMTGHPIGVAAHLQKEVGDEGGIAVSEEAYQELSDRGGFRQAREPSVDGVLYWTSTRAPRRARAARGDRAAVLKQMVEEALAGVAQALTRADERVGAVVFLYRHSALETAFTYNKEGQPDAGLRFRPGEGCTGYAWQTGRLAVARLYEASDEDLENEWGLSKEYIERTKHLKTVVSMPIWDWRNPSRKIGVLSFDSTFPASRSGIAEPKSIEAIKQAATVVAQLLSERGRGTRRDG